MVIVRLFFDLFGYGYFYLFHLVLYGIYQVLMYVPYEVFFSAMKTVFNLLLLLL
ncbi:Uncharacterised protein [Neisseria meningitidis]|nr:Uncharacterised protein [Neisseria meningitidis]CWO48884.1 Uncharacterised protein [Neisseria meningitidis]CWP24941.1 Uncharacterised protein [Neisseria meningitidis]CWT16469.1 Uncharacterised protein [Neisseria meningitidis]